MKHFLMSLLFGLAMIGSASAQMPVIDNANLTQAQQIASNTQQILDADKSIMNYTQKTLQAVTGDRSSDAQGQLSQMALGSGFSMGSAPSLSSVISGGALSFTDMGSGSQNIVSTLLSGLQLVSSITGVGTSHPNDRAYTNAVNVASTLTGLVNSTQGAITNRTQSFKTGAQSIGSSKDIKASIDQNSQIQVQTGQTINELTGVMNNAVTAANQANLDRIAQESAVARAISASPQTR